MMTLFLEGGFPMWFLLAFGLLSLLASGRFAFRPSRARLRLTVSLGLATLFTVLTAIAADLAMVGHQVPRYLTSHPKETLASVLLQGFAESMSPAILGFSVLTVVALFLALGYYRESADL
jgi:uncharacterized membrane protein